MKNRRDRKKKNGFMETKVTLVFLSSPNGPKIFELNDVESKYNDSLREDLREFVGFYREHLVDCYEKNSPGEGPFVTLKIYHDDDDLPESDQAALYVTTSDINELKAGRGDLTIIWPREKYEHTLDRMRERRHEK